jgi:sterol desaturase/sphingolipid hydroxylase (fatty acid hydroxylase superfamily)
MEHIILIANALLSPLTAVIGSPSAKQYWLYLAANGLITAAVYLGRSRRPSVRGLSRYCLPWRLFSHPSAIADYKVWLINNVILLSIAPGLTTLAGATYAATIGILRSATGVEGLHWPLGAVSVIAATIVSLLALDAALFAAHYAQHRILLLWEFHKTHHSASVLTPFTVFRMHPADLILNLGLGVLFGSLVSGAIVFAFGTNPTATLLGINAFEFAFYLLGYHLRHSHVWIMYPGWIGRHISSPALHMIHHSTEPRHHDKNMAQIFTFWDRLAGTLYLPKERESFPLGLGGSEQKKFDGVAAVYVQPFRALANERMGRRQPLPSR